MTDEKPNPPGRRERILIAAVKLLLEVGLSAATTRGVTERAGVGTGLLNHYYRWPELRAAAWSEIFKDVAQDQFPEDQDPTQVLERYFAEAFLPEARAYWQLWVEATDIARSDDAMQKAVTDMQAQMQAGLNQTLKKGVDRGNWQLADPKATALRLGALYDGLAGQLLAGTGLDAPAAESHLRKAFELEADPSR